MTADYIDRISVIAAEMESAMRYRMVQCGDDRPLYIYVSHIDGGHVIGHKGQHDGMWRMDRPVTCGTPYTRVWSLLAEQLSSAPLYAIAS
jgi:hypothetical protein